MRLTITTLTDRIMNVDVGEDLEVENLKAQCEFELGIPSQTIVFLWNGRPLLDGKQTLGSYGVKDGDMLLLQQVHNPQQRQRPSQGGANTGVVGVGVPMIDFGSIQIPGDMGAPIAGPSQPRQVSLEDPKVIRDLLMHNPHERALLKERNPPLSDALESGDLNRFIEVFTKQRQERLEKEREQIRLIHMDPFDPEAQKKIAEEIRLKNVEHNMESAIEFVPESFGQVVMLYIDCFVNGYPVKAFVDSGAQMTIMSQACAERCNIMRLVDNRWAGIAKGVGTQKIIGRVHLGEIQIGQDFLPSSFSILENQPMDMLLGLDMLKRHQCMIDLQHNKLVIGTTGTTTPFLPENELPEHARINSVAPGSPEMTPSLMNQEDTQLADVLTRSAQEHSENTKANTPQSTSSSITTAMDTTTTTTMADSGASPNSNNSSNNSTQSVAHSGASGAQTFPEDVITRIMQKGFQRKDAVDALRLCNGDEQKALLSLVAKSLKF